MNDSARRLLTPLVPLYRLGLEGRERRLASGRELIRRLRFPVISVGNLSTGGSGKTPLTIALAKALVERGFAVDVLSRGYGRTSRAAARVRVGGKTQEFGDEPLLIAREAGVPVYVAPQRYDAGVLAEAGVEAGARLVHILDDGFQHRQLHRDVNVLLVSGRDLEDRLLPAGNLREPVEAMRRATVVAVPADEADTEAEVRASGWSGPVWRLWREMTLPWVTTPVLAFCGIARPEQFFAGVEAGGVRIAARRVFRDHHRYTGRDLERLAADARAAGAGALLTTEKDQVRLAGLKSGMPVHTAALCTEIEDEGQVLDWLIGRLCDAGGGSGT